MSVTSLLKRKKAKVAEAAPVLTLCPYISVIVILLWFSPTTLSLFSFLLKTSSSELHFCIYISYKIKFKTNLWLFSYIFQNPSLADPEASIPLSQLAFPGWTMGGILARGFWQIAHELPSVPQLFQLRQNSLRFFQPPISYAKW